MEIKFKEIKEQEDGSAIAEVEMDEEFVQTAINFYIISAIKDAIKKNNLEEMVAITPCSNDCTSGKNQGDGKGKTKEAGINKCDCGGNCDTCK